MTFDPIGKIISKHKLIKDKYGKDKKVLMLVSDDPNRVETDKLFQSRLIDDNTIPKNIKIPYMHTGGSVLEVYGRRKRK